MATLILSVFFTISASAYDVEVDGIYYILAKKVAVVASGDKKYGGEIIIPESITVNEENYTVTGIQEKAFHTCNFLTSITIPNSVTSIGSLAFRDCSGLTSITIPKSVTTIEPYTFRDCSGLVSITIGTGIKKIGSSAFGRCQKLETVTCLAEEVPETSSNAFEESWIEYATLTVPESALQAYKTSEPWSGFGTFKTVEEIGTGTEVETKKCETPTISFVDGKLTFDSTTEGVEYVSEVKCSDAGKYYTDEINLAACYDISVTAMKTGYENSDVATAKLYWLTSSGTLEGSGSSTINNVAMRRGIAIQSAGGFITISGLDNNEMVRFYALDGKALGTATAIDGTTSFTVQSGTVVVAQIGNESIKIAVE